MLAQLYLRLGLTLACARAAFAGDAGAAAFGGGADLGQADPARARVGMVTLLEKQQLSSTHAVYLVRVLDRKLLLGGSASGLSLCVICLVTRHRTRQNRRSGSTFPRRGCRLCRRKTSPRRQTGRCHDIDSRVCSRGPAGFAVRVFSLLAYVKVAVVLRKCSGEASAGDAPPLMVTVFLGLSLSALTMLPVVSRSVAQVAAAPDSATSSELWKAGLSPQNSFDDAHPRRRPCPSQRTRRAGGPKQSHRRIRRAAGDAGGISARRAADGVSAWLCAAAAISLIDLLVALLLKPVCSSTACPFRR